jgi:hypothetical protein
MHVAEVEPLVSDRDEKFLACAGLRQPFEDALNQVVWRDDKQVTHATVVKQYGERPSLKIEIRLGGQR